MNPVQYMKNPTTMGFVHNEQYFMQFLRFLLPFFLFYFWVIYLQIDKIFTHFRLSVDCGFDVGIAVNRWDLWKKIDENLVNIAMILVIYFQIKFIKLESK